DASDRSGGRVTQKRTPPALARPASEAGQSANYSRPESLLAPVDTPLELRDVLLQTREIHLAYRCTFDRIARVLDDVGHTERERNVTAAESEQRIAQPRVF